MRHTLAIQSAIKLDLAMERKASSRFNESRFISRLLQWIRIAWRSENRLEGETSIDDLRDAWARQAKHSSRLVADDGARRWKEVRGPVGAMMLSLDRLN